MAGETTSQNTTSQNGVPVFLPPCPPVTGSTIEPEVKVLTAGFGDGYTQRAPDGIHNIRDQYSLSWEYLDTDQARAIEEFLRARRGAESFLWKPPGEPDRRRWICSKWKRTRTHYLFSSISATFVEVFDL
ncbi:phage tail protein [Azospirillum sp. TSA6c]|uniref:phage tail protein n=1 Tax=unclassified Azospirillum TaxID=2630922 RepID=UPI000D653B6A|nr:phage tail protein [Azospirillum sp. TSA6c]